MTLNSPKLGQTPRVESGGKRLNTTSVEPQQRKIDDAAQSGEQTRKKKGRKEQVGQGPKGFKKVYVRQSAMPDGTEVIVYEHKDGMTPEETKALIGQAMRAGKKIRERFIKEQQPEAKRQLTQFRDDILKIRGKDKSSGRYILADLIAVALKSHALEKGLDETEVEKKMPRFGDWTWLRSNGFVLGDPRAYMRSQSVDKKKAADRALAYKTWEGVDMPKKLARIQDRIGDELDQIVRWARAERHNRKAEGSKMPKVPHVSFPANGFVAYLAEQFQIPELQSDSLIERIGDPRLKYEPYEVVSVERKADKAREAADRAAGKTKREQKDKATAAERSALEAKRDADVGSLLKAAATRKVKFDALHTELQKNLDKQPRPLRDIAHVVDGMVKGNAGLIADMEKSSPKARAKKGTKQLPQSKLEKFGRDSKDFDEKRWPSLEERLNAEVRAIPEEIRNSFKLVQVKLDNLSTKELTAFVANIKEGFARMRREKGANKPPEEQLKDLENIVVPKLRQELAEATMVYDGVYAQRAALKKTDPNFATQMFLLSEQITMARNAKQKINGRIDYILKTLKVSLPKAIAGIKNTTERAKLQKEWEQRIATKTREYKHERYFK